MFLSRISELILCFYFNSVRIKYSSLCFDSTTIRRLQYALKIVVTFVISGLIAYGTRLRDQLDQQYLICVISVLSLQETIGSTLYSNIQTIISILPLSILLFIIQIIGLNYGHYFAAELLLLILSLIIAYQCTQIQTRKITLLYNAIFFCTIVNERLVPILFVFLLLELFLIGMGIATCVSLFLFPFFATFDIENRFNYSLYNLQRMYQCLIQAFLSQDQIQAKISLSRAAIIQHMIRQTIIQMQTRIFEAKYEPSRLLQKIFYRKRKHIIDLNIQEQANLINSLMINICSIELMLNECEYNEYHHNLRDGMKSSIVNLSSCQSSVISSFTLSESIRKDELTSRLSTLSKSIDSVLLSYKNVRLNLIENILLSKQNLESKDDLSHAFFLFQLFQIVKLLTEATTDYSKKAISKEKEKKSILKDSFKFEWPRFFLAIKTMIIIGVGSIFVMVPYLAKIFENGQWILIALCMTQADTVGGAFTTMKMRLIGTLLGAMWSYITYLLVHNNVFETFLILIPWIFLFGYLKLFPKWGYTATVAAFTPILINLGRLPYGDRLSGGDYALLRIEENLVGILIGIILTMTIFPVFAIDLLKENIQKSLESCKESIDLMNSFYDENLKQDFSICFQNSNEIKSFLNNQRSSFGQLINNQRLLISNASIEPSFCWFQNRFSSIHYHLIVQQQTNIFRMLHNIDSTFIRLSECSIKNENQLERVEIDDLFLRNLHKEIFDLIKQVNDCLNLWSSYFNLSKTRCYQLTRAFILHRTKLVEDDLLKYEKCLMELHKTIHRFENEHQQEINRLFDHYFHRLNQGENPKTFLPYAQNQQTDFILLTISAMDFSIQQLAQSAICLGTTIHEVFELEITDLYQTF